MLSEIVLGIIYILIFFTNIIVLWRISIWQKLKRQDLATAFVITAITTIVTLTVMIPYLLGITFPLAIRILISVFSLILTLFLIKLFYQVSWGRSLIIYLLVILFVFLVMTAIFFVIFTLYIGFIGQIFKYF